MYPGNVYSLIGADTSFVTVAWFMSLIMWWMCAISWYLKDIGCIFRTAWQRCFPFAVILHGSHRPSAWIWMLSWKVLDFSICLENCQFSLKSAWKWIFMGLKSKGSRNPICFFFMPPPLGAGGIMFSGCPSVRPSVRSLKYPLLTCTWVRWSTRPTVTVLRHVRPSVCPSVRPSVRRGFRAFAGECMEGLAWNFTCWCILTIFRTD